MKEKLTKILIVAGVIFVVYYLWKKGVFTKAENQIAATNDYQAELLKSSPADPDAFAKELKAHDKRMKSYSSKLGLTDAEKETFLNLTHHIYIWLHDNNEDHWNLDDFIEEARNAGKSVEQHYANTALWAMCPKGWAYGQNNVTGISEKRYNELYRKL